MGYTPFALAAVLLFAAACSNDEPSTLLVRDAQAAPPPQEKDYGWKTTPDFSRRQDEAREYY